MPLISYESREAMERVLPQRKGALIIDSAYCSPRNRSATGFLSLCETDPRIRNHFGIFPGHLALEFAHLTGVLLIAACNDGIVTHDHFVALSETFIRMHRPASPPDELICRVRITDLSEKGRRVTLSSEIKNQDGIRIASAEFTGSIVQ